MKNNGLKIFLIIILSLFVFLLVYFMIKVINSDNMFFNFNISNNVSKELIFDEAYNNDFNKIDINSEAANIYIKESFNDEVRVVIYGIKENILANNNNQILSIDVKAKKCNFLCINNVISKVEIYLPSTYNNLIEIENNLGDIEIGGFKDADINIKEDCGDVEIKSVNNVNVDNNLGEIEIDNIYNSLDLNNDCGDIKLDNVYLIKDSTIKLSLGDVEINNINQVYIEAETDLGDLKINNNYKDSDIVLKIENDCGDIKVSN